MNIFNAPKAMQQQYLEKQTMDLMTLAAQLGFIIEIRLEPTTPLRMGGYIMSASVREKRTPA